MNFISFGYLLYFPLISLAYYLIPHKFRWFLLLLGSYFFYACWSIKYAFLMLFSSIVTFACGFVIQRLENTRNSLASHRDIQEVEDKNFILYKKLCLILSLAINLVILFFFKYFNFLNTSISELFAEFHLKWGFDNLNILLPVGISFYTFQALSYTFDVYYKKTTATTHFGKFALYVSFFPQLVAGPIERSWHLLPQFNKKIPFNYNNLKDGLLLILKGILKKIVIADRLAVVVNKVYGAPENFFGLEIIVATIFFAFQIYCDFSAYTDIARGSARVMGFDLMKNFNRPYFATSIPQFWKRWHISLTTWFRDYLYIPLGGNRVSVNRWYANIIIIFLVSGLWHGAAWNFVIWGLIHGIFQLADIHSRKLRKRINKRLNINDKSIDVFVVKVIWTFLLTCFAWVFFRANSFSDAILLLKNATIYNPWTLFDGSLYKLGLDEKDFIFAILSITFLLTAWYIQRKNSLKYILSQQHIITRCCIYILAILFIIIFGYYGSQYDSSQFIYFQF